MKKRTYSVSSRRAKSVLAHIALLEQWAKRAGIRKNAAFRVAMDLPEIRLIARDLDRAITRLGEDESLTASEQGALLIEIEGCLYSRLPDYYRAVRRPLAGARSHVYKSVPNPTLEETKAEGDVWMRNFRRRMKRIDAQRKKKT